MKPFNLDEALAGKPLVCRNGKPVTQFVEFKDTAAIHPLVGVCDEMIIHWTMTGFYNTADGMKPSEWDLFMAPDKKSIWVNVYLSNFTHEIFTDAFSYRSKHEAIQGKENEHFYIKTIEITNEI